MRIRRARVRLRALVGVTDRAKATSFCLAALGRLSFPGDLSRLTHANVSGGRPCVAVVVVFDKKASEASDVSAISPPIITDRDLES